MKRFVILMLFCLLPFSVIAAASECPVKGSALHWAVDYCMYRVGTDDFESEAVQACLDNEQAYELENSCANRTVYKRKLCASETVRDFYPSVEACFDDASFAGPTVRNGGV